MPSLEELFKNKKITEGPNTGLTAEMAYAPQNSKSRDITSSNVFVKKVNTIWNTYHNHKWRYERC
jgi:hypothetical protein